MRNEPGFTLTEVVIVLAIMAVLLGLGLPSYRSYTTNQRILSTAEVFMAGMQMARAEAVKLNQRVEFILTNCVPTVASVDLSPLDLQGSGANCPDPKPVAGDPTNNWMVRVLVTGGNTFVEGKSAAEGSGRASASSSPVAVAGSVTSVTFDGFGVPVGLSTTATFDFSNPGAGNCLTDSPAGPVRCVRLRLNRGGQARLCDPSVAATDTRACGT